MSAVISECGRYRYRLTRSVGMGSRVVVFVGVNPSTADAATDDATVRKWCGFARRWGFDKIEVVNLFAFRSTDVRALAAAEDPVGPRCDEHLAEAISAAEWIVPCWGSSTKVPGHLRGRIANVSRLLLERRPARASLLCLGRTSSGDPRHPLMLGYNTPLEPWR